MTRTIAVLLALVIASWLGYVAWATGYRIGYEDGTARAWAQMIGRGVPTLNTGQEDSPTQIDLTASGGQRL